MHWLCCSKALVRCLRCARRTESENTIAAFRLGMSLSAAMSSKNVGLWEPSPPTVRNDIFVAKSLRLKKSRTTSYISMMA